MSSTNAVFTGDGTLLVRCAQAWLAAGHRIERIATHSEQVIEWAHANQIHVVRSDAGAPLALAGTTFDYLFSVANLQVLRPDVIARARVMAINFHDGPLPRYAGLNATSWALMAREFTHGITWHEMTTRVDAGRIVRQVTFDIADGDTALGLNMRCYEAGLAAFEEIAQDIASGQLSLSAQSGDRRYFARDRRPEALGTLDWQRPATELIALVRGLDYGSYPNPLALPKIWTGTDIVLVRSAHPVQRTSYATSYAEPGTVLRVEGDTLQVATALGDISLGGCTDAAGRPGAPGVIPGQVLPALSQDVRERFAQQITAIARGEIAWRDAWSHLSPVDLPYPRQIQTQGMAAPADLRAAVRARSDATATTAAFMAWLAALTGQERVSISYADPQLAAQAQGLGSWLSMRVPLSAEIPPGIAQADLVKAVSSKIAACRAAGPCTRDLPLRLGERQVAPLRIGIAFAPLEASGDFDLLLVCDAAGNIEVRSTDAVFSAETFSILTSHLDHWLRTFDGGDAPLVSVPLTPRHEAEQVAASNQTGTAVAAQCMHTAFDQQVARTPDRVAVSFNGVDLRYAELAARADMIAHTLVQRGVRPGDVVGLCLPRCPDLVAGVWGILKAGAAYLPLDPEYPAERIRFMIGDSATRVVVTDASCAPDLGLSPEGLVDMASIGNPKAGATLASHDAADSPAYLIYTSGSTGKPKGVVVTHANVINFFAGMDSRIAHDRPARWLAVTSLSFDISVLELCWTLTRGLTVVLHSNGAPASVGGPEFSLFYFASDHASRAQDRYRLLMEGARFADQAGFTAVWTPERHFHAFGGLYPNPAVTSAALAAATTRVQIRAGSCVLPLHHPIRVAEEWAFVDNISQGRVGVSFAAGWQPNDFVISPEAFADRKNLMLANLDVVRRLWRGETVAFDGPHGKPVAITTLPRPIQPELPVWLTAAGNPETFEQAGRQGCRLLTHLLGQTLEDVAAKVLLYHAAWRKAGHPGRGHVTLMLHTFVGDDEAEVRELVRGPMKEYLRSSVDLIRQAAWSFPTFVQRAADDGRSPVEIMEAAPLSPEDLDALLEHAFNRYYGTSALFGTPERCLKLVDGLSQAGVDEIACLIDFGVATDTVLAHLHHLRDLMKRAQGRRRASGRVSVAEQIVNNDVTHLQCTPSMASMLIADAAGREALGRLEVLMVGGEALPLELARELRKLVPGDLLNMYGPTETTIWSTTCRLDNIGSFVPLGSPIANTTLALHAPWGGECPALVPGELLIGGDGVAQGYWLRPELNAERFVERSGRRFYRTGDLVRRHADGALEFLGRIDHQVKIRGHRIELGEIESALASQAGVQQAVVVARGSGAGDQRISAYVTQKPGAVVAGDQLRAALAHSLPDVMVPQQVVVMPSLPLTPNGKVDRGALPDPGSPPVVRVPAAPQSQLEQAIAAIWQEVLGVQQVGPNDNFFDLGGHSLLVVQVQRRLIEVCGREVSITDMFRLPTIRALAVHLGGDAPITTAVGDGMSRANARRFMRSRTGGGPVASGGASITGRTNA
ncbi:MAG: MupA/Atu3671 family FMN-dependent luciferase-like monooxygenase [Pseudomonadota bacterium]